MPADAHRCPWPGCTAEVPASMWGCREHWRMLPLGARRAITAAAAGYRRDPTEERCLVLVQARLDVREWIREEGMAR